MTQGQWQMEYMAQYLGAGTERYRVHRFGNTKLSPWYFPSVWLYFLAGCWELLALLHSEAKYNLIFPQDGIFTAAFTALAAKIAGVRVVCIDHAHLTWLSDRVYHEYRRSRLQALDERKWPQFLRLFVRLLFELYGPSLHVLARIGASYMDHYLVPGVVGDGVEDICAQLGVPQSRLTRFASMIDVDRHVVLDSQVRQEKRSSYGIPGDAIVIAIVCRLSEEKGLHIALASIEQVLKAVAPDVGARLRVVIAGDGPLRAELEASIERLKLNRICMLLGDIPTTDVPFILGMSDIFLYTSTRGACFAMAVLEAMASGCAVIASTEPASNAILLADGRGIAVPANDRERSSEALRQLVENVSLCRQMGELAREYIATHHSPAQFKRALTRLTYWAGLTELLVPDRYIEKQAREK
jgi:glycosyltransferase involved in cell wall biosynthesis